jgi:SAM-dependent methyltransferase
MVNQDKHALPLDQAQRLRQLVSQHDGQLSAAHSSHIIAVASGKGGVGKTRLAIETARVVPGFADGIAFVSLAPVAAPESVVSAIGDALGFTFVGSGDLFAQLLSYLRERHVLLILDNLEHLLDSPGVTLGTVEQLLQHAPGVSVLATSRERLRLVGEWVVELRGLLVPQPHTPAQPSTAPALMLFVEHAERVESLLRQGKRKEAKALHNQHVESQFAKAQAGEAIDLSDLIAGASFARVDVIERADAIAAGPFDLIGMFGVLHHVPGEAARVALLRALAARLASGGTLAVAFWRTRADEEPAKRVPWESAGIEASDVEPGDRLLRFDTDASVFRFAHFADEPELARLASALELPLAGRFDSDGAGGVANAYLSWRRE